MSEQPMRLDAIFQYNMTKKEADVYKICLLWEKVAARMFPGESYPRIPKRTDPRKSHLFRHCWKMFRETRGILEERDWERYITANLTGIKKHSGRIDPNCLAGDKAWKRWRIYKWLYEKAMAVKNGETPPPSAITTSPKIVLDLDLTKKFLYEKCGGEVTEEKIAEFIKSGIFKLWVLRGKVSPYYVMQSPWVRKHADLKELGQDGWFDPNLIQSKITPDVDEYFRKEFDYEF